MSGKASERRRGYARRQERKEARQAELPVTVEAVNRGSGLLGLVIAVVVALAVMIFIRKRAK